MCVMSHDTWVMSLNSRSHTRHSTSHLIPTHMSCPYTGERKAVMSVSLHMSHVSLHMTARPIYSPYQIPTHKSLQPTCDSMAYLMCVMSHYIWVMSIWRLDLYIAHIRFQPTSQVVATHMWFHGISHVCHVSLHMSHVYMTARPIYSPYQIPTHKPSRCNPHLIPWHISCVSCLKRHDSYTRHDL